MSSQLSSIGALFAAIQERANEISSTNPSNEERHTLVVLLILSFLDAMEEIRLGADFEQFQDLAVLNLIMRGSEEGYTSEELKKFVSSLKRNLE